MTHQTKINNEDDEVLSAGHNKLTFRHIEARRAFESNDIAALKSSHTKEAILKESSENVNLSTKHSERHTIIGKHIKDIIYGGLDGLITTFAIVSGVAGASLSSSIILILGIANLLADGFSMAVSNYMGTKAEIEFARKERKREEYEVDHFPEGEREEIRNIYRKKGFKGEDLEKVVNVITSDKKIWVDTMMVEELGILTDENSPIHAALATFISFLIVGAIPLSPYIVAYFYPPLIKYNIFYITTAMTAITIFTMGALKSKFTSTNWLRSGIEMFLIGGLAAAVAYYVGYYLSFIKDGDLSL